MYCCDQPVRVVIGIMLYVSVLSKTNGITLISIDFSSIATQRAMIYNVHECDALFNIIQHEPK